MGIVQCQECGKSVSNLAAACVHCGNPYIKATQPQLNSADYLVESTSIHDKNSKDLTNKPMNYVLAFVFGGIGFWGAAYGWGVFWQSSSTCPFVGFVSQNWDSFNNAFLCYDEFTVVTAEWSQIPVFSRTIFLLIMIPSSFISSMASWFFVERGRKAI